MFRVVELASEELVQAFLRLANKQSYLNKASSIQKILLQLIKVDLFAQICADTNALSSRIVV